MVINQAVLAQLDVVDKVESLFHQALRMLNQCADEDITPDLSRSIWITRGDYPVQRAAPEPPEQAAGCCAEPNRDVGTAAATGSPASPPPAWADPGLAVASS